MRARTWAVFLTALALAAGVAFLFGAGEPAQAEFTSAEASGLVDYIESGASLNLRLMALDALRRKTDSGIEGELEKLAKGRDILMAAYATTQLGRKKTTAAKTKLRGLVTSTSLKKDVRKAAMTAIAVHWRASADLTWLESKTASDTDLKAHALWLTKNVYQTRGER